MTNRLDYRLLQGESLVYAGIARKMPGQLDLSININKIAKDYLYQSIEELIEGSGDTVVNEGACLPFTLTDALGNILESYSFLYDWEKGHQWSGGSATLSLPVNGEYVDGQMKLKTIVGNNNIVTTFKNAGDYDKQVCADFVLYYLNSRGGWDAFAYTGKCVKTTDIKSYTADKVFDNNTAQFEISRYASELTDRWDLNTGLLTDGQSEIYASQLAVSNQAYLHIINEGSIIPVVITDTSVTHKEQKWEDNNIISYKTSVKASQKEYRV